MKPSAKRYFFICILLAPALAASAGTKDTVPVRDTLALYKKIRKFATRHKITRLLYQSVFVDPAPQNYEAGLPTAAHPEKDSDSKLRGKIIRSIHIRVYDPFGYSVNDTCKTDVRALQKLGNGFHLTTRHWVIRNLLLLRPMDTVDLVKLKESERLIRTSPYVNDARIYLKDTSPEGSDSVDVYVMVKDRWSLEAWGDLSTRQGSVTLLDDNILGTGTQFEKFISREFGGDKYEYMGKYNVANISNSFISSSAFYSVKNNFSQAGIAFDRPLYSPLARWAGGVSATQTWNTWTRNDTVAKEQRAFPVISFSSDEWAARNIQTGKSRIRNIIVALRHTQTHYQDRPPETIDTGKLFVTTRMYLASIGFSVNSYYKDQYIFRFGANEDIPEGLIMQYLYGLIMKEEAGPLYYSGADVSYGRHYDRLGYLSGRVSYGDFFCKNAANNFTLNAGITYFTDLLKNRRWYYRQFVYLKFVDGLNKPAGERIALSPDELYGLKTGAQGTCKALLNLEGVAYAPYNLIGFRFAPLVLAGFGTIKTEGSGLFAGRIYESYAIGLLLRNENLLASSFKFTFGIYPDVPHGTPFYKINPVTSFSVRFRGFSILKPDPIRYE